MTEDLKKDIESFIDRKTVKGYFGQIAIKLNIQDGKITRVYFDDSESKQY